MPIDFVGKVIFPRLQPWQRRRQLITMVYVLCGALIFATAVAAVMVFSNAKMK